MVLEQAGDEVGRRGATLTRSPHPRARAARPSARRTAGRRRSARTARPGRTPARCRRAGRPAHSARRAPARRPVGARGRRHGEGGQPRDSASSPMERRSGRGIARLWQQPRPTVRARAAGRALRSPATLRGVRDHRMRDPRARVVHAAERDAGVVAVQDHDVARSHGARSRGRSASTPSARRCGAAPSRPPSPRETIRPAKSAPQNALTSAAVE